MKKFFTVLLMVLPVAFSLAQKDKKDKATGDAPKGEKIYVAPKVVDEGTGDPGDIGIMDELQINTSGSGSGRPNTNGSYFLYENYPSKELAIVYTGTDYSNRLYALLNTRTQQLITPYIFKSFTSAFYKSDYAIVNINENYGTIDSKGNIVIPVIYDQLNQITIDEQFFFIAKKESMFGVINDNNEIHIPFEYEYLSKSYSDPNLLTAKKHNKYGIVNLISGKTQIPFEYDMLDITHGVMLVKKGNLFNLINQSGKVIFTQWYSEVSFISENLVKAKTNGKFGILDLTGNTMIPFNYESMQYLNYENEIYLIVESNGKYGVLRINGTAIIPLSYDNIYNSYNGNLIVQKNGLSGVLSVSGKTVIPVENTSIEQLNYQFLVNKNNTWGLLNKDGSIAIPLVYEDLRRMNIENQYRSYYFIATKKKKKGVIDNLGNAVIDFQYDNFIPSVAGYYSDGTYKPPFIAVKNGKYGMIESENKEVVPFEYEEIGAVNSFLFIGKKNGKYGLINIYTKEIVLPIEYSFLSYKNNSLVGFKNGFEQYQVKAGKVSKQ